MRFPRWLLLLAVAASLAGCAEQPDSIAATVRALMRQSAGATGTAAVDPAYRWLRAVVDGRVTFLVLGEVDRGEGGMVEVWFSVDREALRLRDGRMAGIVGLSAEWRRADLSAAPDWRALLQAPGEVRWSRVRDVMPGYRLGVRDDLVVRRTAPRARSALAGVAAERLAWFEEVTVASTDVPLPPAVYALDIGNANPRVVYAEQCISTTLCFSWQAWPPDARAP